MMLQLVRTLLLPYNSLQCLEILVYAQRTHITLQELGLPFDVTEVSGIPKPDWFLSINPRGKVPTLRIPTSDYAVVYESAICNEFLCDYAQSIQQEHTLMPSDPFMRAKIRLLNDHCDNVFAKTQFTYLMNKEADKDDELCAEMESELSTYEEALSKGPYLLGDDFSLADIHVFPFIQRLVITLKHYKDYELPSDKFPKLLAWIDTCQRGLGVGSQPLVLLKDIVSYGGDQRDILILARPHLGKFSLPDTRG